MRDVDGKQPAAVERSFQRERLNWPNRIDMLLPCISRGVLEMTLTTPVIALAPQTADAGPRITSICLISLRVDGQEVPRDEPEEVLVDATAHPAAPAVESASVPVAARL